MFEVKIWENYDKLDKSIGFNKKSICQSQMGRYKISGTVSMLHLSQMIFGNLSQFGKMQ